MINENHEMMEAASLVYDAEIRLCAIKNDLKKGKYITRKELYSSIVINTLICLTVFYLLSNS